MLDKKKVHVGIAPIAWTEDDMPEMGAENSFLQTISEISLAGYTGTEIGCQFPHDAKIMNKELGRRGLSAITGWISTYINERPMWWNERAFVDHMNFLKSIGATLINTSDQSFSVQHCWDTPFTAKHVLNDDQWEVLAKGLDHLGKIAYDNGMHIIYHPHMTTTVQKTGEIDRMLEMTDAKYVNIIFDTGHLAFSGEDPVEILRKHHDRIKHVHLKDVRKSIREKCYADKLSFLHSIPEGVFNVPGDSGGMVDFPTVFRLLDQYHYEGWLVVEAEQDPSVANPLDYARLARAYVREQTGL
ncbi:MAG: myo-inosose-2 dehydratase [Spirochaetia bacterium]|jgi:inosose dehydratase|nr:myo-inosose-2 dehydratase [Spirochaetia bacterium]